MAKKQMLAETMVEPVVSQREALALKLSLQNAEAKIREELFRFRTCCADPRASK